MPHPPAVPTARTTRLTRTTPVPNPAHPTATRPAAHPTAHRSVTRRTAALMALLLVALVLLGGCTRVRAALAVQGDDTVAGEIVLAVAGGPAPALAVPPSLAGRVTVAAYRELDYQGWRLQFSGLRFDEVNSLVDVAPQAKGRLKFDLRRTGGLVVLKGQVDLASMPVDKADVQLKVAFPGEVSSSDGTLDSDAVSWVFTPGQVSEFTATVNAPDPGAPSIARWSLLVGAIVLAAAAVTVILAKAHRNPPVRSGGRGP